MEEVIVLLVPVIEDSTQSDGNHRLRRIIKACGDLRCLRIPHWIYQGCIYFFVMWFICVQACSVLASSIVKSLKVALQTWGQLHSWRFSSIRTMWLLLLQTLCDYVFLFSVKKVPSLWITPSSKCFSAVWFMFLSVSSVLAVPTGQPQEIHVEALSSTEVKVSWKPPPAALQNGDLLGYKIFYEPRGKESPEKMEAVPPTTMSFVLLDLRKYMSYNIQVLAFNPAGDGPRSDVHYVTTMEDVPGAPGRLIFSDITMTSLNVSWAPPLEPNGKITAYLIAYETALPDTDFSKQVKQKVTSSSLSVHGLAEMVTYTFRVRAKTFDYGPESISNITTGPQEDKMKELI